MRFAQVDRKVIVKSAEHGPCKIKSGSHEAAVYFCWEIGNASGLAPALVSFAAARESVSRTPRFEALVVEVYRVMAKTEFSSDR